ncbi:MAG: hypothetical protein JSS02_10045 [Planctomycetes bacterium]|nr:hypothetical protein [Planctomycetota bacterium]
MLHLGGLIEIAAHVSIHSPTLIEASHDLTAGTLERFEHWTNESVRHWQDVQDGLREQAARTESSQRSRVWQTAQIEFHDLFGMGLVTRIWGAIITARLRTRNPIATCEIASQSLARHEQTTQQVLRLLADGPYLPLENALVLDRLRRKIERWTDVFIGHLVYRYGVDEFAFDSQRARDFGEEQVRCGSNSRQDQIWEMYLLCLRTAFPGYNLPGGAARQRRTEILKAILACMPADLFLGDGLLAREGLARLLNGPEVVEGPPSRGNRDQPDDEHDDNPIRGRHDRHSARGWTFPA